MTKAERAGLLTYFNALSGAVHNSFWLDINGRLYFNKAPQGTLLSNGPYATFFVVVDSNDDTFTEEIRDIQVQFSLFSGNSSADQILDMDEHLTSLLNRKSYTISGARVTMLRQQGEGPILSKDSDGSDIADEYWQTDIDYLFMIQPIS